MRYIFTFIIAIFILTACSSPQPTAAPTADVTLTPQPTSTEIIPTLTPVPAFPEGTDPTMTQWQDENGQWWGGAQAGDKQLSLNGTGEWESTVKLPPAVVEAVQAKYKDVTVFGDEIIDTDGKSIPEIHIKVGEDNTFTTQMAEYEFEINGEVYTMPEHKVDLVKDENGKWSQPAFNLEDGQWVRTKALAPDGVTELEKSAFSIDEFEVVILTETSKVTEPNWQDENSATRKESKQRSDDLTGKTGTSRREYQELVYVSGGGSADSRIYIVDKNGVPIRNEDDSVVEKPTVFYSSINLPQTGQTLIGLEINGIARKFIIDSKVEEYSYYKKTRITSWVMTQEEYDAIKASLTLPSKP